MTPKIIISLVGICCGLCALILIFTLIPLLGSEIEKATEIPCDITPLYASLTINFTGNVSDGDYISISNVANTTDTYEFDTAGNGVLGGRILVDCNYGKNDSANSALNLTNAVNLNDTIGVSASQLGSQVILQIDTIGSSGNSYYVIVASSSIDFP